MFRNTLFMSLSTLARLLTSVILFMFLARMWGVEVFGLFMYWFTVTSLIILVVDYGFSQSLLKEIGEAPSLVAAIMGQSFVAKLILALLVVLTFAIATHFIKRTEDIILAWFLLVAGLLNSFAEFFNAPFRAIGSFHHETKVAILANIVHFIIIMCLLLLGLGPLPAAVGFVFSRAFNLWLSWYAFIKIVGKLDKVSFSSQEVVVTIKSGFPFAIDAGLTNFYSQVDTLLVNHFLGAGSLGIYQAGLRLLQGANIFAPVLSNVYLPTMASKTNKREELSQEISNVYLQMMITGITGAAFFIVTPTWLAFYLYGVKYSGLSKLLPYFGLLLLLRYLTAAHGVTLTAVGLQTSRAYSIVIALSLLIFSSFFLIPMFGLKGMIFSSMLAIVCLDILYIIRLRQRNIPLGLDKKNILITLGTATLMWFCFLVNK